MFMMKKKREFEEKARKIKWECLREKGRYK